MLNPDEDIDGLSKQVAQLEVSDAQAEGAAAEPAGASEAASAGGALDKPRGLVRRVVKAHADDIHGICVSKGHIITGSKDTSVKLWSMSGDFIREVAAPPDKTYRKWVTALSGFPDGSVVIGYRNGYLLCKDVQTDYRYFSSLLRRETVSGGGGGGGGAAATPKPSYYKERNEQRVMGVLCQEGSGYRALVGLAENFLQLDCSSRSVTRTFYFKQPEWVYGFAELAEGRLAAIHGCALSVFKECEPSPRSTGFEPVAKLVSEDRSIRKGQQRPFISDVKKFRSRPSWLALSFFGGQTRVIDAEKEAAVVHQASEHRERVWQAIPKDHSSYVSCADDGSIKFWDVRKVRSIRTYEGHPGRVSAMALLDENSLVAGTCAADPHADPNQGQLFFYDTRI